MVQALRIIWRGRYPLISIPVLPVFGIADSIVIDLDWANCCTDGFVISGFNPDDLFIGLLNVTGDDLDKVIFLNPDRGKAHNNFVRLKVS